MNGGCSGGGCCSGCSIRGKRSAAPRVLGRYVGGQRLHAVLVAAGIIGELDGYRLGGIFRCGAVQLLDGPIGLKSLIEAYKANALGET